jgi:hypothetical protein
MTEFFKVSHGYRHYGSSSRFDFSFSPALQTPHQNGLLKTTLTIKLKDKAFKIPATDSRLHQNVQTASRYSKKDLLKTGEAKKQCDRGKQTTASSRQQPTDIVIAHLLSILYPSRWGIDLQSAEADAQKPTKNVPWVHSAWHPSTKPPVKDYRSTDEEWEQKQREWDEFQESLPVDSRKPPSWVSRPLCGSQDNGNGGWTPLGNMGRELSSDLEAETWRLPSLFPYMPNAVNTL